MIARLLADNHQTRLARSLSADTLGRIPPKGAATAVLHASLQVRRFQSDKLIGRRPIYGRRAQALKLLIGKRGRFGDHDLGAARRRGHQFGDQRRLGEVLPILLRHLRLHHARAQTSRIEGRGVVGAPEILDLVVLRRLLLSSRRAKGEPLAVPVGGPVRGKNAPPHRAVASREEGGGLLQNAMRRLEPGDPEVALCIPCLAKTDEGLHLVAGAAHVLHPLGRGGDIRVGDHPHQIGLVPQPPQQTVHQVEPVRRAMQD
ncbi:hypothetical protein D3C72_1356720 [compost metagenome]